MRSGVRTQVRRGLRRPRGREAGVGAGVVSRFRLLAFPGSSILPGNTGAARGVLRRFAVAIRRPIILRTLGVTAAAALAIAARPALGALLLAAARTRAAPCAGSADASCAAAATASSAGCKAAARTPWRGAGRPWRCRGTHRCPTFPRGPHPGNHGLRLFQQVAEGAEAVVGLVEIGLAPLERVLQHRGPDPVAVAALGHERVEGLDHQLDRLGLAGFLFFLAAALLFRRAALAAAAPRLSRLSRRDSAARWPSRARSS